MLLSNGSLGCCPPQAWHRDSKGPCPLPGLVKNRQVDMTKIVIITETPNVTMPWTRMIGHYCTMISLKRVHSCNGHFHFWTKKQCRKWFGTRVGLVLSRVHKLSYAKRKKFFCSLNFFCEKFPIKHCSTHNMWIRWSFRSISSSYLVIFIGTLCIFEYLRIRDWQPIS